MFNQFVKIFVVDDDRFHLQLMNHLLNDAGIKDVVLFENGMDCLSEIHQNPGIVFLDHQMDVYTGYETLRKIKRYNPNIFVVMVSGQDDIRTAVNTLKYGAFDYIQKDQDVEENVRSVLKRIDEVKNLVHTHQRSFFKSLFNLL